MNKKKSLLLIVIVLTSNLIYTKPPHTIDIQYQELAQKNNPASIKFLLKEIELLLKNSTIKLNSTQKESDFLLHHAITYNFPLLTQLLLEKKINPNVRNKKTDLTPLDLAAIKQKTATIKLLLESSMVNPNIRNNRGNTVLHILMFYNKLYPHHSYYTSTISLLLKNQKIDPNIQNNQGFTPLHVLIAYRYNCPKNNDYSSAMNMLLEHPAINPNSRTIKLGNSPLHTIIQQIITLKPQIDSQHINRSGLIYADYSQIKNLLKITDLLLNHPNIDLTIKNNNQETLLHRVAHSNKTKPIAKFLLENHINKYSKNKHNQTPLDIAFLKDNKFIIDCFKDNINLLKDSALNIFRYHNTLELSTLWEKINAFSHASLS